MHTVLCVASLRDFKAGIYLTEWFFGISLKDIGRVIAFLSSTPHFTLPGTDLPSMTFPPPS